MKKEQKLEIREFIKWSSRDRFKKVVQTAS